MELLTDEEILKKGYNALEQIGGTVKFAFNKFQQIQQLIRSATPQPINQALDALSEGVEYVAGKTPIGVADRGASALGEMVGQATGNELLGQVVGFGAGMAVPGPEISRAAKPVIPKGIKPEVIAQSPTLPPMGPSPAMALASSGGGVKLSRQMDTLTPQIMPLTVTEPGLIAEGVTEGIAKTPKYKKALQERRMAVAEIEMRRQALIARGSKSAKKLDADLYGEASTLNIDPSVDPIAYKKRKFLEADPTGTERFMHQHHLFPKGGSYAFIERMEQLIRAGVADQDDLVNMFAYAEKLDATMGNRLSNMLNAPAEAHIGIGGIHPTLRTRGLEKPVTKLRQMASQATNANEVMKLFSEYIATDVIPSKQIAKEITDTYLKSKKNFTKSEQSAMELFLEQLRERGA